MASANHLEQKGQDWGGGQGRDPGPRPIAQPSRLLQGADPRPRGGICGPLPTPCKWKIWAGGRAGRWGRV